MDLLQYIPMLIIATTTISSIIGFSNREFFDRYKFNVGAILGKSKQWDRILTSSSLHGDWLHLIFNMWTLYAFSPFMMSIFGVWEYLAIYFISIVGGGLLSLLVHRKEPFYSAIGASGGVVGLIFAAIAVNPNVELYLFFALPMPGWVFGIAYLAFSVYGMHKQLGNIGHEAHLGGAIIGLTMAISFIPQLLYINTLYIVAMIIPLIILAYLVWKRK